MPYTYAFFLGSHPDLSASEVVAVLTHQHYSPTVIIIEDRILLATLTQELPTNFLDTLGGIDRIAHVLAQSADLWSPSAVWSLLFPTPPSGKVKIGLSSSQLPADWAKQFGHALKETARAAGISVRFVTTMHRSGRLNAAQVQFNHLTKAPNAEIVFMKLAETYYLARTTHIQDIVAYEQRDTKRPARDAKIGMLPPKLAQIMINLATSHLPDAEQPYTIYDPFCGMGTILQESWLHDYQAIGSDSNPEMVKASEENLNWLTQYYNFVTERPRIFQHDVQHPFPKELQQTIDAIVTEPYLGRPLSKPLHPKEAPGHINHLAELYLTFARHAYPLLKTDAVIVLLLPAFRRGHRANDTFTLFPQGFLDAVADEGYSLLQLIPEALGSWFTPSPRGSLLYARPDALVGREVTIWKKR